MDRHIKNLTDIMELDFIYISIMVKVGGIFMNIFTIKHTILEIHKRSLSRSCFEYTCNVIMNKNNQNYSALLKTYTNNIYTEKLRKTELQQPRTIYVK